MVLTCFPDSWDGTGGCPLVNPLSGSNGAPSYGLYGGYMGT